MRVIIPIFLSLALAGTLGEETETDIDDSKIVGGRDALRGEFPHQARLEMIYARGKGLCGGSMISEFCVLTAAHCVARKPDKLIIKLGYLDIKNPTGDEYDVVASRITVYPDYDAKSNSGDLALVCVDEKFPNTETSARVELIDKSEPLLGEEDGPGGNAVSSGWGTTGEGGRTSNTLKAVNLTIFANKYCETAYKTEFISRSMICAGDEKGGKDSCQGDSGGPLIKDGKLCGIVSWGYGCARKEYPGVYTRVSTYIDWIVANW